MCVNWASVLNECLLKIGFKRLANEFLEQSLTPCIVFEDGHVEKASNNELDKITFFKWITQLMNLL